MIHVAMATTTIRPNRIVYADGSVKRDFVGSPGSAGSPPLPVSTTCVAPTVVSASVDMKFRIVTRDHHRHAAQRFVREAVTDAWAVASPCQQRDDTEHNHDRDHPAECT